MKHNLLGNFVGVCNASARARVCVTALVFCLSAAGMAPHHCLWLRSLASSVHLWRAKERGAHTGKNRNGNNEPSFSFDNTPAARRDYWVFVCAVAYTRYIRYRSCCCCYCWFHFCVGPGQQHRCEYVRLLVNWPPAWQQLDGGNAFAKLQNSIYAIQTWNNSFV